MFFKPDFYNFLRSISGTCKGFIRVVLNLSRPINVLPGTKPPSVLNLTQESLKSQADRTLTSFYLPPETEKTLCVTNATRDVIRSLLSKLRIVDNPHKYVSTMSTNKKQNKKKKGRQVLVNPMTTEAKVTEVQVEQLKVCIQDKLQQLFTRPFSSAQVLVDLSDTDKKELFDLPKNERAKK